MTQKLPPRDKKATPAKSQKKGKIENAVEKRTATEKSGAKAAGSKATNERARSETTATRAKPAAKSKAPASAKTPRNKPEIESASIVAAPVPADTSLANIPPESSREQPETVQPEITPFETEFAGTEQALPAVAVSAEPPSKLPETEASPRDLEEPASTDEIISASSAAPDVSPIAEPEFAETPELLEQTPSETPEPLPEPVMEDTEALEAVPTPEPESVPAEPEPPVMDQAPVQLEQEPAPHHPVSTIPSMFIVQITPELAPVAKVGGLADVVFGISNELEIRGNHVEIILPKYDCLRYDHIWGLCETYNDLWVPWYGGAIHCTVYFGFVHGRKCFFIEPHSSDNFFSRGCIYGFNDDVLRFAFFTRAAMEFLWKSGKNPEIIHCHDWQTALVPVFLFEIYKFLGMPHPRVCFTIHNFKHQGVTGAQVLQATGLNRPEYYFHYDRMRDNFNPHALNLMKAGVVYSNFVTTVSPRHASEAKDQGQGFGLEPTLHIHHVKYGGVVNGIDYNVWNPEIDHHIPHRYGVDNIDEKYKNKKALRDRLMIADNEKPIVAFVGRLDPQKGLELIRHAIFYTLYRRGQFVLLGSSPDGQINSYFWSLKHQLNDNPDCHIEIGFNEELSHLIYAGADIMLVPSQFEPCGLTQLIAMRYGTIPVVREVGGLADTVFDKDYSHKPLHERNGYVFRDYDYSGLESALGRALSCYYDYPDHFRELMKNAMRYDYSWKNPGQDYLNIYDLIREK
jgi:starch synthase